MRRCRARQRDAFWRAANNTGEIIALVAAGVRVAPDGCGPNAKKEQAMADLIETPRGNQERTLWPPWVNLVIGVWLIISAFAWPHLLAAQTNAWMVGTLIAVASVFSMFVPSARYVATVLSIWLFFSAIAFSGARGGTPWHDVIAAIVVFLVSLVPATTLHPTSGGGRPVHA
jgi:hypothetical protein